jgi:hypothetical protein
MSDLRAALLQLVRVSGSDFSVALLPCSLTANSRSAAAATAAANAPKAAQDAQLLQDSNHVARTTTTHKIVTDGRGRHTARANSSPWVLNADSLLKNGGKSQKLD